VIYHLIVKSDWEQARQGNTEVAVPGADGFVHCCDAGQVSQVRTNYYPRDQAVVALTIDPIRLASETRYEPGTGGEPERFPHVYGPILVADVIEAVEVNSV
jgi:uncharacterized protein (DUF952 family)